MVRASHSGFGFEFRLGSLCCVLGKTLDSHMHCLYLPNYLIDNIFGGGEGEGLLFIEHIHVGMIAIPVNSFML